MMKTAYDDSPLGITDPMVISTWPKKPRQSRSNEKSMLIVLLYVKGVVYHKFWPTGTTVNTANTEKL
jgi:hypothetical protein